MGKTSKFGISRRTVIRGAGGLAIALPWLEVMGSGSSARAETPVNVPKRFVAVYSPGGTVLDKWRPTGTETQFTLSPILSPFERVRDRILIPDGLYLKCGDQSLFSTEQRSGGMMGWLTGLVPKTSGAFVAGPSIDQVLAPRLSKGKRFPSLQMAVRWGTGKTHGKVSPLNSCVFADAPEPTPILPMLDPVEIWKLLFNDLAPPDGVRAREQSILDLVDKRYETLARKLGSADRARLEAHLEHIRALEKRIAETTPVNGCAAPTLIDTSTYNPLSGLNSADDGGIVDLPTDAAIPDVGKLMMDMTVMALACDMTAVSYLQWCDAACQYTFPWLNLPRTHEFYENGGGYKPVQLEQIYTWYATQHAYLVGELARVDMGGHSLLDETLVYFGTELQGPANYSKKDMPFLLAGAGLRTGRWVRYEDSPPHNNLLVSLLNAFGDIRTTFGDERCCTGPLPNLS